MAVVLTWQSSTPGQPQYQLATLTERYKVQNDDGSQINAAAVLNDGGVPQIGDAHPDFSTMFCTDRHCAETGESASSLDLIYTGTFAGIFPTQKETSGGQLSSATTNTSSAIFPVVATNPATVQYYAGTTTLDFYSDDPADASEPTDPPTVTSLVSWDLGFGLQPGGSQSAVEAFLLGDAFVQAIVETPPEIEPIVDGEIYHIIKRKTRTLFPYTA